MSMQTDVKAASVSGTGTVFNGRARVKGLVVEPGAAPGSVVFRDGGAAGTTLFTINTPTSGQVFNVLIPGEGVLFASSVHVTLSDAVVTVFYG